MNYIAQLQDRIKELEAEIAARQERDLNLVKYLTSQKFRCGDPLDGYVNVVDVLAVIGRR